jgi:hypothetical protein
MNDIFDSILRKFVLVFFDDILIYNRSWEDHIHHLSRVFEILRANRLYARKGWC